MYLNAYVLSLQTGGGVVYPDDQAWRKRSSDPCSALVLPCCVLSAKYNTCHERV
jgi:hypothetical protein